MIYFCTYFDKNYLSRFLTLSESINKFKFQYTFFILALDDKVVNFFEINNYKYIKVIRLEELEIKYKNLLIAKKNRDLIEYYFTLTPFLPRYIFYKYRVSSISYLDCDFYFFKSPKKLINKNLNCSVVLTKQYSDLKYGLYNVGWIYYNLNFSETKNILRIWSDQCINFCRDIPKNGLYAEQKYLDDWCNKLKNIKILEPKNTFFSPWDKNIQIEKNHQSLIAFHFHGLEFYKNYFVSGFSKYNKKISKKILKQIYIPYIKKIIFLEKKFFLKNFSIRNQSENKYRIFLLKLRKIKNFFKRKMYNDNYSYKLLNQKLYKSTV
jgi:hypothetical protein